MCLKDVCLKDVCLKDVSMTAPSDRSTRLRAYFQFVAAVFYFFLARYLAHHGAATYSILWSPLVEQVTFAFLLLLGYAAMGFWWTRQDRPINQQGLPRREGWLGEIGLGLATGWSIALVCVLPMALAGGIAISFTAGLEDWGWLLSYSTKAGDEFALHCANIDGTNDRWLISIRRYGRKVFGRDKPPFEHAHDLISAMRRLLESEESIIGLEWLYDERPA